MPSKASVGKSSRAVAINGRSGRARIIAQIEANRNPPPTRAPMLPAGPDSHAPRLWSISRRRPFNARGIFKCVEPWSLALLERYALSQCMWHQSREAFINQSIWRDLFHQIRMDRAGS